MRRIGAQMARFGGRAANYTNAEIAASGALKYLDEAAITPPAG